MTAALALSGFSMLKTTLQKGDLPTVYFVKELSVSQHAPQGDYMTTPRPQSGGEMHGGGHH